MKNTATEKARSYAATARLDESAGPADAAEAREPHNFLVLVVYHIAMRTGWIFKTESIIMPAVLDTLGGAAWLRGCLPLLNRFGQSIPPLLLARRLKILPRKKWAMAGCTACMSLAFLVLSGLWRLSGGVTGWWMPAAFLVLYAAFFMSTGVNQLSFSTVQGKLIRPTRRGRLLLASNVLGAALAIACAWLLLPLWLSEGGAHFGKLFAFTGLCFAFAAATAMLLVESDDDYEQPSVRLPRVFGQAWETLQADRNFRCLALVASLFGTSIMLFPHYQALGRTMLPDFDLSQLMGWVIVQNVGTALFSLIAGPLADRHGNRLVLRLVLLGICGAPLAALLLTHLGTTGQQLFPMVFVLVGMTPVAIKTLNNYTLEIADAADHTQYLSTLSLCIATPILAAPLVGLLVDLAGFHAVFLGLTLVQLAAWLLTFRLQEPRHHIRGAATAFSDDS